MKADDIILAINGQAVKNGDDLVARVADMPVGTQATLTVDRDGKKMDLKLTIQDRTKVFARRSARGGREGRPEQRTGKPEVLASEVRHQHSPRQRRGKGH